MKPKQPKAVKSAKTDTKTVKTAENCAKVRLGAFVENPDNPSTATDEEIQRLAGKLKRVPLGLTAMRIAFVTDRTDAGLAGKKVVISGNKRLRCLKAAFGDDGEVPAEWFADVTAMSEAERHEFIVSANVSDGSWDVDKLLAQYDRAELGELMGAEAVEELLKDVVEDSDEFGTDFELKSGERDTLCKMTFVLTSEQVETIKAAVEAAKPKVTDGDTFGNTNQNGNAIYKVCEQWLKKIN